MEYSSAHIEGLAQALSFVQRVYAPSYRADGITSPMDGVLVLDTGVPGPTVAINAMMHLSEPAGLAAHQDIVERWENGDRPSKGKVILTLGHPPDTVRDFLAASHAAMQEGRFINYDVGHFEDDARLAQLAPLWQEAKGRLLDIHSTPGSGDASMLIPYYPVAGKEKHSVALKETAQLLQPILKGLPVRHVVLDYYSGGRTSKALTAMFGNPSAMAQDACPLVLEAGGPNLEPQARSTAALSARAWLENVAGWRQKFSLPTPERFYYSGATNLLHPARYDFSSMKNPPFNAEELADTYYTLTGPNAAVHIGNPDHRAMMEAAVARFTPAENNLRNFQHLNAGTPFAIGGNTGRILTTGDAGYPLWGTAHSFSMDHKQPSYLLVTATERHREKDLLPPVKATGRLH